jgi:pyridoxamine 5'-phosphate oxidase
VPDHDLDVGESSTAAMRVSYEAAGLSEADLAPDWLSQFGRWFTDAVGSGLLAEPNAMVVATTSPDGRPSARTVLLKGYDERGFLFFTNLRSRKATEALGTGSASLVFSWPALQRQIVICGAVEQASRAETEAYFATRPRGSQLGAWASPQSEVVPSRERLDAALAEVSARWPEGSNIPAPEHWGGLRVIPETVEFWQGQRDRLHDRLRYRRTDDGWVVERLGP